MFCLGEGNIIFLLAREGKNLENSLQNEGIIQSFMGGMKLFIDAETQL